MVFENSITCDGNTLNIKCPNEYKIDMEFVSYGRSDFTTCTVQGRTVDGICLGVGAETYVNNRCNNSNKCEVPVNAQTLGQDCDGYEGYLTVSYRCKRKYIVCTVYPILGSKETCI